MLTNEFVIMV
jgi:outer membrane protein OmpA-like peptidoglycan-associated protein